MKRIYQVLGMQCSSCVEKIQKSMKQLSPVKTVDIDLDSSQMTIFSNQVIPVEKIRLHLAEIGNYQISENQSSAASHQVSKYKTYYPLFLIVLFIVGVGILVQYPFDNFSFVLLMRHFMAGFFIVFSFFKLLDVPSFIRSYRAYDIIAKKWKGWAWLYPYLELGLGIAYLIDLNPFWVNTVTVVVMGISSLGVIQTNLARKQIECACLGTVFKLPMSVVTVIEDVSMVIMALAMLFLSV